MGAAMNLPEVLAEMRAQLRNRSVSRIIDHSDVQRWVAALAKYEPLVAAAERWTKDQKNDFKRERFENAALALFAKEGS